MSNGEVCCILGVCCPPEQRAAKIEASLTDIAGLDPKEAKKAAQWLDATFDFAPKGMLTPLIHRVASDARTHPEGV